MSICCIIPGGVIREAADIIILSPCIHGDIRISNSITLAPPGIRTIKPELGRAGAVGMLDNKLVVIGGNGGVGAGPVEEHVA